MEQPDSVKGCLIVGSVAAVVLLLLGIAVPLAGATDFNGLPRSVGAFLAVVVWVVGLLAAVRGRWWTWALVLFALGPLPLVIYGTRISNDFGYPEDWAAFASPPWYLIALILTPLPVLMYALSRNER